MVAIKQTKPRYIMIISDLTGASGSTSLMKWYEKCGIHSYDCNLFEDPDDKLVDVERYEVVQHVVKYFPIPGAPDYEPLMVNMTLFKRPNLVD